MVIRGKEASKAEVEEVSKISLDNKETKIKTIEEEDSYNAGMVE